MFLQHIQAIHDMTNSPFGFRCCFFFLMPLTGFLSILCDVFGIEGAMALFFRFSVLSLDVVDVVYYSVHLNSSGFQFVRQTKRLVWLNGNQNNAHKWNEIWRTRMETEWMVTEKERKRSKFKPNLTLYWRHRNGIQQTERGHNKINLKF